LITNFINVPINYGAYLPELSYAKVALVEKKYY